MTGQVTTVDGRVAGRRGQATRQKLLDCLGKMLGTSPYRDIRVIDLARTAGTSPATFYQYFPDVEAAVLEIAEGAVTESADLSELVEGRSWTGQAGRATAEELVDGMLAFWRKNESILRVIDLGAAEGDRRFVRIRTRVHGSLVRPLSHAVEAQSKSADVSPTAVAGALVTMVAGVATQTKSLQSLGTRQTELKPALTQLMHLGVTGRRPAPGGTGGRAAKTTGAKKSTAKKTTTKKAAAKKTTAKKATAKKTTTKKAAAKKSTAKKTTAKKTTAKKSTARKSAERPDQ